MRSARGWRTRIANAAAVGRRRARERQCPRPATATATAPAAAPAPASASARARRADPRYIAPPPRPLARSHEPAIFRALASHALTSS